jgi:DEAD/DEAH box helicase domain-containing protein
MTTQLSVSNKGAQRRGKVLQQVTSPISSRDQSLGGVIRRFEALRRRPNSPIAAIRTRPARDARFVDFPEAVDSRLRAALAVKGIERLYVHQAQSWDRVAACENVVVVTPTASGKTLCYNLPVLNKLAADPSACALYLFPTKALAVDQLEEFNGLSEALGADVKAFTYDGDTPSDARRAIRRRANVVLSNPDMLHAGLLPHHTRWARFFERLRYIVIDELHTYRGVFGSHVANVLRRLKRIAAFYGAKPSFVCCSATIANPKELAQSLVEEPFALVDDNGAPCGERHFVFYNPPVVNRQLGIRRSYINEARRMAESFLERGRQTLVFANNRLATEVLTRYLKQAVGRPPGGASPVRGYRGGYLPRERREIERQLRNGEILGVVATNALELGIDIGSLDVVVLAGYPGSIASTWQRAGRAGRRQGTSVSVLVASSAPLDQYVVEHPEYFFEGSPEQAHVNPDNLEILVSHLKCAVFELPVQDGEAFGPHDTGELCRFLEEAAVVHHAGDAWHWTSESYPADAISLRKVTSDNFVVVDVSRGSKVIGEVSFPAALTSLHEKAIYIHEGRLFHVERFEYDERKAYVKRVECGYYTDAIEHVQVETLEGFDDDRIGSVLANHGEVRITRRVVGFKKIRFHTNENVGDGKLSMPEQEMHTTAFWLHFPMEFLGSLPYSTTAKRDGLLGLGNVLRTVGAVMLMCDARDLGISTLSSQNGPEALLDPELFLYDNYPGGIGQSEPLFRQRECLGAMARELIEACPCKAGCPSCVGAPGEVGEQAKEVALRLAESLVEAREERVAA